MKIKDLKKQLIRESKYFVPDLKNKVYANVGFKEPIKTKLHFRLKPTLAFLVLLFLSLSLFIKPGIIANSFVIIEINPSIELEVNQENKVVAVNPLNPDGYFFLESLSLEDNLLNDALVKIVDEATNRGFLISETSKMTVTAVNKNKKTELNINTFIKTVIETHKPGIIRNDDEVKEEAKQNNVSTGRMLIIKRAMEVDSSLTLEVALNMDVNELVAMLSNKAKGKINEFEDKYKENLEKLKSFKEDNLNNLKQSRENFKAEFELFTKMNLLGLPLLQIHLIINQKFPEYQVNNNLISLKDITLDINNFYDEYFDFLEEIIEDNYEKQKEAYKNKVNHNSNNEIDDYDFNIEEIPFDRYKNRYTESEKEVIKIINRINVLIKNNFRGSKKRIEDLYEEYVELLAEVRVEFIDNEIILKFTVDYNNYLKNSQNQNIGNKK